MVRAEQMRYVVPGWGVGELWTADGVVLAHDFDFHSVSDTGVAVTSAVPETDMGETGLSRPQVARPYTARARGKIGTEQTPFSLDTSRCLTPSELVERFAAFFAGEDALLQDVPLDLSWATPFQHAVADSLHAVPRGEVVSYGELAALAGHPGAQRAVGTFCARNRFMLLLPCHRVVGADGIGGYGSAGVAVKRRLLALERVVL
jgi:methylated-DNA-[protein]-cysteine S-methyltransferase